MKNIFFNFLLIIVSISTSVLTGELICRVFDLSKTYRSYIAGKEKVTISTRTQGEGSSLTFTRKPNNKWEEPLGKIFKSNSLGFRAQEFQEEKGSNVIRIGILGDSVAEGYGVEIDDRFSNKLYNKLNQDKAGHQYEVYNFSVGGYSTINEIAILNKYVLNYNIDHIILQMCSNDIQENYKWQYNSASHANNDNRNNENAVASVKKDRNIILEIKSYLQKKSALYLTIAERYQTYKLRNGNDLGLLAELNSIPESDWKQMDSMLIHMNTICKNNNISFTAIYIPIDKEVNLKTIESAYYLNNKLKKICMDNEIDFLEVLDEFRDNVHKDLYIDDCHLNPSGHEIITNKIFQALKEDLGI